MKRLLFMLLMMFFASVNLASTSQAGKIYTVVEPKITIKKYKVVDKDTLSQICSRFYGNGRSSAYNALAAWGNQVTHEKLWVFVGQILEIPFPLILNQNEAGINPTILPIEETTKLTIKQLKQSLTQTDIQATIPNNLSKSIISGLKTSQKFHNLNNEIVAAVSFGKKAQGWTMINVKKELIGKSTSSTINKNFEIRATLPDCNNLYLQLIRVSEKKLNAKRMLLRLPPPPPFPPILKAEIQKVLLAEYAKIIAKYGWDWDSTGGYFKERYTDGNNVKGWWQSSVLYPFVSNDIEGNEWSFGLAYTIRDWSGETGEVNPFYYNGIVNIESLAGRFRDSDRNWEILGRVGLGQREDSGYLTNEWGRFDTEQETNIFNAYSSAEYSENKTWFSKIRVSGEVEIGLNEEKESYWTDQWDGRQKLDNQPDDKDRYEFALYSDVFTFDEDKNIQIWSEFRSTYYNEEYKWGNGIKGGLSFLNGSLKVGLGYTAWNQSNADSTGFYGEVNLYNLYHCAFGYPKRYSDEDIFVPINQKEKEEEILEMLM
ncbi:MAG: hypothetical protein HQ537_00695 [Parcubacteria group bacterium]|nr:hypothetical protein [Parcubacteria group bacterium]